MSAQGVMKQAVSAAEPVFRDLNRPLSLASIGRASREVTHPVSVVREVFPVKRWEVGPLGFGPSGGPADRLPTP